MGSFCGLSFAEEQKEEVKEITAVALTEILVVKCYPAQTMCSVAFYVSAEESLILLFCLSLFCCTSASQQNTSKEPHSHIMLLFFYSMTVVVILNKRSVFLFSRCSSCSFANATLYLSAFIYLPLLEVIIYWRQFECRRSFLQPIDLSCLSFLPIPPILSLTRGLIRNEILIYSRMVTSGSHLFPYI